MLKLNNHFFVDRKHKSIAIFNIIVILIMNTKLLTQFKYFGLLIALSALIIPNINFSISQTTTLAENLSKVEEVLNKTEKRINIIENNIAENIKNPQASTIDSLIQKVQDINFQIELLDKQLSVIENQAREFFNQLEKKVNTIQEPQIKVTVSQNVSYAKQKIFNDIRKTKQYINKSKSELAHSQDILTALDVFKQLNKVYPMMTQLKQLAAEAKINLQKAKEVVNESLNYIRNFKVNF